ncbi:EZH inhibitory protein-like [Manis pentadactyla]|uniref:EZH inhibitory protein-like n=1 Tax=Manis pentadactyla TaxID=143292 RepID=UPI00255C36CE|nr:EZH inhibitory protein-like [Manis pentadactyla]
MVNPPRVRRGGRSWRGSGAPGCGSPERACRGSPAASVRAGAAGCRCLPEGTAPRTRTWVSVPPRRVRGPGPVTGGQPAGIRPAGHPVARHPPALGPEAGPLELSTRSSAGRGLQPRPRRQPPGSCRGRRAERGSCGRSRRPEHFPGRRGEGKVPRKRRQTTAKGRFARTSSPMLARTPAQTTDRCYFRDPRCGRGARRVVPKSGSRLSPALYNPAPGPGAAAAVTY